MAALAIATGCAGDKQDDDGRLYAAADAKRIANVRPLTPGWPPWPQSPEKRPPSSTSPEEQAANDPIVAAYRRKTADLAGGPEQSNKWRDEEKLGNFVVQSFATPAEAHAGFLAFNDPSRGYAGRYGYVTKAEEIGLGDEGWVLWASSGGTGVTYHWRRANLVIEAHLDCYGDCPGDVDAAARTWAEAIDEEARKT